MSDDAGRVISDCELGQLADLFLRFEGAPDPTSLACKEVEQEFDSMVGRIYAERIAPKYSSITLPKFVSYVRNYCRKRIAKEKPPYPCISPPIVDFGDAP
jgi:hypothetical protein